MRSRRSVLALCAGLTALAAAPAAPAATTRSCGSLSNPYPGTRFEGADITRIAATGVSCATARRVARGAHRRALGLTPTPSGIRTFTWDGWRVRGDLRPSRDLYVATRAGTRVRWRF